MKNIVLSQEQRNELKQIQIEMLSKFIDVCRKFNLSYFLVGGSALGAIRHGGFIPWDDDIDVALPRNDYETFLKVAQYEFGPSYFLQNYLTEKEALIDFSKIRKNGTTFYESTCEKRRIHQGIFIDIFPIDGYPDSEAEAKKLEKFKSYRKKYLTSFYKRDKLYKNILMFIYRISFRIFHPKNNNIYTISQLNKTYISYQFGSTKNCVCHGGVWGRKEICPTDYYGRGKEALFEGIKVKIPEKYDEYLEHKYPNYMTLPPIEKQIPHHYCLMFSTTKQHKVG